MILDTKTSDQARRSVCVCVCVCVIISFVLDARLVDAPAGVTQNRGRPFVFVFVLSSLKPRPFPSFNRPSIRRLDSHTCFFFFFPFVYLEISLFPSIFVLFPLSLCCIESTSYVLSFRMVFFYLVTTGWIVLHQLIMLEFNQSSTHDSQPSFCGVVVVVVIILIVVFFTLTDRASTIPSNIRGCQSGTWSQRGTKVNGSHHGDNPLLRPTGIQIATKSYATLQAMTPTNNKRVNQTSFTSYREQPRSTRIVVAYPRPAFSATNRTNTFQPVLINNSKFLKATHRTKIRKFEIPRSMVVEALSW